MDRLSGNHLPKFSLWAFAHSLLSMITKYMKRKFNLGLKSFFEIAGCDSYYFI